MDTAFAATCRSYGASASMLRKDVHPASPAAGRSAFVAASDLHLGLRQKGRALPREAVVHDPQMHAALQGDLLAVQLLAEFSAEGFDLGGVFLAMDRARHVAPARGSAVWPPA